MCSPLPRREEKQSLSRNYGHIPRHLSATRAGSRPTLQIGSGCSGRAFHPLSDDQQALLALVDQHPDILQTVAVERQPDTANAAQTAIAAAERVTQMILSPCVSAFVPSLPC